MITVVAVSDTYRDEISDGYPIWDRIYYGWHHILGWHTYPGMAHLPGNFNSGALTWPNEISFTHTNCKIPGHTAHSVDHTWNSWVYSTVDHMWNSWVNSTVDHTWNSWAYSTQLITRKIPGHTAIMQPSHSLCTLYSEIAQIWCDYGVTFAHVLTYLPNPCTLSKKAMAGKDIVSKLEYSPVKKIRESAALLVRHCSSHLGEYSLTLWVVSILMYAQEFHNYFFVSCVACLPHGPSTIWQLILYRSVCPRISNILINNINCMPMISSASTRTTVMYLLTLNLVWISTQFEPIATRYISNSTHRNTSCKLQLHHLS